MPNPIKTRNFGGPQLHFTFRSKPIDIPRPSGNGILNSDGLLFLKM
jgi:hypothetical protein